MTLSGLQERIIMLGISVSVFLLEEIVDEFSEEEKLLDLLIRAKYSIFDWNSCFDLCQEVARKK